MGRSPCCSKQGLNRGAWTALEDKILTAYIKAHGEGKWRNLPKRAGLKRCGKSCRLRWLNYLRPDIKRGNISHDEEELIIRLHKLLGNRWSLIAGRLPGRTDNEIKNYWNTTLAKKADSQSSSPPEFNKNHPRKSKFKKLANIGPNSNTKTNPSSSVQQTTQVIRTKATRCSKVLVRPLHFSPPGQQPEINTNISKSIDPFAQTSLINQKPQELPTKQQSNSLGFLDNELQASDRKDPQLVDYDYKMDFPEVPQDSFEEPMFKECWNTNMSLEDNANLNLEVLGFLLDSEDWP